MNTLIVDNFLPYPNVVREWALNQEFLDCEQTTKKSGFKNTWPGLRTNTVNELDMDYANIVLSRIAHIARTSFDVPANLQIASSFQLTTEKDGNSWIHKDDDSLVAGLLYLTPNAPIDSGTILYSEPPHKEVDIIGNVYNRLIMYRSDVYHKSNKYFGRNLRDGRLTQVFFVKVSS
jgi:hypothetical protein